MEEYRKIETLLDRDEDYKVIKWQWRLPEFEWLQSSEWQWTEKIDGMNIRVIWQPEIGVEFRGKTDNARIPIFLLNHLRELFTPISMETIFKTTPVCLYGEGFGAKIQSGGKYIPTGCDFTLFDVKVDKWWLERENLESIARRLNISIVPIVGKGNLINACIKTEKGFSSQWGNCQAEGLVIRPPQTLFSRKGERLIGKIKTKDF